MKKISRREFIVGGLAAAAIGAAVGIGIIERRSVPGGGTTSTSSVSVTTSERLSALAGYLASGFNPELNLTAQGTDKTGLSPVQFYFFDGTPAPRLPPWQTYEPNECWKTAIAFRDNPPQSNPDMSNAILAALESVKTDFGWRPPWKDESILGVPTPYSFHNNNMSFTKNQGLPPLPTMPKSASEYAVNQAAPFDTTMLQWIEADLNPTDAMTVSPGALDEGLYEACNFYIRGDYLQAVANLNQVASYWDGSGFGTPPYRGEFLGIFLFTCRVLGITRPSLGGRPLTEVEDTLWALQNSDGGISRSYYSTTNRAGSDNETSNAALLAYSPSIMAHLKSLFDSKTFDLTSSPPVDFVVNPFS